MDIRQLRYFVVIAEEGQLTRAAQRLHMAQPPLSRQLKLLEQEVGVMLFERNGRHMNLTEAGKLLFRRAESILNQLEDTITEVKDTGEGLRGVLYFGTIHSCIPFLSKEIYQFRERYPKVSLKIWEESPSKLIEQLENRIIELAILRPPFKKDNFSIIHLPKEPLVLVVPSKWKLLQTEIQLQELNGMPFMLLHNGKEDRSYHQQVIDECSRIGIELDIVCECHDAATLLMLVTAGIGATILPKSLMATTPSEFIKAIEFSDYSFNSESSIIWLKDRPLSKTASRFIETLIEQ